jgi:hypothetical protein
VETLGRLRPTPFRHPVDRVIGVIQEMPPSPEFAEQYLSWESVGIRIRISGKTSPLGSSVDSG